MLPGVTTLSESLIRVLGPKTGKPLESIFGLRTVGGTPKRVNVCTSCIKAGKVTR